MNGHPIYLKLLEEMAELHKRKMTDYGTDEDPFANIRASEDFGVPAWLGCLIRMHDKVHRLKTYAKKRTLANESVEDNLMDLAAYALIALTLFREGKDHNQDPAVESEK